MKYDDDFGAARTLAVCAFGQLDATRTPPSPQNFELFYAHAAGLDDKLSAALSEFLRANQALSPTDTERLYEQFLGAEGLSRKLEEMARNLARMVQEAMRNLTSATKASQQMDAAIEASLSSLGGDASPQQMQDCMHAILELARNMKHTNEALEANFATSMEQITELNHCLEIARTEASIDPVTGVANRACFDRRLAEAVSRASTLDENLSLLMIDADRFKALNDKFGHQTGDAVLRILGHMIRSDIKGQDLAARYGGEEFAVILPNTSLQQARAVAEKIRQSVRSKSLHRKSTGETLGRVTVSIGIAEYMHGDTAKSLIARADKCLYAAKHAGRDCVKYDAGPAHPPAEEHLQAVAAG